MGTSIFFAKSTPAPCGDLAGLICWAAIHVSSCFWSSWSYRGQVGKYDVPVVQSMSLSQLRDQCCVGLGPKGDCAEKKSSNCFNVHLQRCVVGDGVGCGCVSAVILRPFAVSISVSTARKLTAMRYANGTSSVLIGLCADKVFRCSSVCKYVRGRGNENSPHAGTRWINYKCPQNTRH